MSKAVCTNCQYIYDSRLWIEDFIPVGTSFGEADDSVFECPQCQSTKDSFLEIDEIVIEATDPNDLTELESEHIPAFFCRDEALVVQLWALGSDHPDDPEHRIEWIEVRDEYGDPIERQYTHQASEYLFSIDMEDPFEVIACCNIHGLWKGLSLKNENL